MIGRLLGTLIEKQPPLLLLDLNGVGYEVAASMNTFYHLPEVGQEVTLHIHFVVRDDAQLLYGFIDNDERSLFRLLIKVNGVGPKLALTLLSSITPAEFAKVIAENNSAALVRLPGVGKKTAERLIIEMRDRLKESSFASSNRELNTVAPNMSILQNSPEQDAISALIGLGYKPQEASRAIIGFDITGLNSEEIIRKALQGMG